MGLCAPRGWGSGQQVGAQVDTHTSLDHHVEGEETLGGICQCPKTEDSAGQLAWACLAVLLAGAMPQPLNTLHTGQRARYTCVSTLSGMSQKPRVCAGPGQELTAGKESLHSPRPEFQVTSLHIQAI